MFDLKANEETIKSFVAEEYFSDFDCRDHIGNIDFTVAIRKDKRELFPEKEYLLWAESKRGKDHELYESFIQLILTIGKERTTEKVLPPKFLGAFDAEKIAFIPFGVINEVLTMNDFNWNVTPSDRDSDEFKILKGIVTRHLTESGKEKDSIFMYCYDETDKELRHFIKKNFVTGRDDIQRMRITHNNFKAIYERWRKEVMPSISINWEKAKQNGLLDSDFYLADLIAEDNKTLLDKLHVLLRTNHYELDRQVGVDGLFTVSQVEFSDDMQAYNTFWAKYARPPKKEYWDKIVERRDLLVPQDIRERKGSYFTPQIWVEKSQEYLAEVLGENWQEEYYIWDCCAGTGNLLAGLTNKYNVWASTLDKADVDVMLQRIEEMGNGSNLLVSHIFQFDFLNDDFSKLPLGLQEIINDEEKRKKLVIYINPPYAEAGSTYSKEAKIGVSNTTMTHKDFASDCGKFAKRELFVQFFMRIYKQIPGCILAEFSKLKIIQAPYFRDFRHIFAAKLDRSFIVPADTFDNVSGKFPIGFFIWRLSMPEIFSETFTDVYDRKGLFVDKKYLSSYEDKAMLNDWLRPTWKNSDGSMGYLVCNGNDFQHQNEIAILSKKSNETSTFFKPINKANVLKSCIYLAVRHCVDATWLNDRDQFLFPNDGWKEDGEFQGNCIAYVLFHGQNYISSKQGINHWIPFTEQEVDAPDNFQSHFMSDFIAGKNKSDNETELFLPEESNVLGHIVFSPVAANVMEAGRKLWYYYLHHKKNMRKLYDDDTINVNASFYDIRVYFQGRDEKGKMNSVSSDEEYMRLLQDLRAKQKVLAKQIEEKVYKYGFLK